MRSRYSVEQRGCGDGARSKEPRLFGGTGEREFGGIHPRQRSALAAVGVGVFAGRAAQHRPEVVDEMRLVVPAEADREIGEVDIRDRARSPVPPAGAGIGTTPISPVRRHSAGTPAGWCGRSTATAASPARPGADDRRRGSALRVRSAMCTSGRISPAPAAIASSRPAAADVTSSSRCIGAPNKSASTGSTRPVSAAASRPKRAVKPPGRNRAPTTVPHSLIVVRNTRVDHSVHERVRQAKTRGAGCRSPIHG